MHRQDTSPNATAGDTSDQAAASDSTSLARRRALLSGLGKGGALLAAAAPVSSFAAGRVKTADGKQCTVSGQMSAMMSQNATANPCAAFHTTAFFASRTKDISNFSNAPLKQILNDLTLFQYHLHEISAVYYKRSSTEVRKLTPLNWSGAGNAALAIGTLFNGAGPMTVLQLLHSASESDLAYFAAAYFSALRTASPGVGFEKVPFQANDVKTQWGGANNAAAATLYRLVCTEGKDTPKLG